MGVKVLIKYSIENIKNINKNITNGFPHLFPITDKMVMSFEGVSRLVMLDRYTQKDLSLDSLSIGDLVIAVVRQDPKFPARGIGNVVNIDEYNITIKLEVDSLKIGRASCR